MTTNNAISEIRGQLGNFALHDCYIDSVVNWLLRAAIEGLTHDDEINAGCVEEQHAHRLARLTCSIHCALNSLVKYSEEFQGDLRKKLAKMQDAYYQLRYAHEDHMPGGMEAPEF